MKSFQLASSNNWHEWPHCAQGTSAFSTSAEVALLLGPCLAPMRLVLFDNSRPKRPEHLLSALSWK